MSAGKSSIVAACVLLVSQAVLAQDWSGWQYSRDIFLNTTSSGANVAQDVSSFPVLVRLYSTDFPVQARAGGDDVRFADAGGTELPYEIERWDATGKFADIWVLVGTVKASDSTQIQMFWGNSGAGPKSSGAAVFGTANNFVGVWHLGQKPAGAGSILDATTNAFHGNPSGSPDTVTAIVGVGMAFDSTQHDRISFGDRSEYVMTRYTYTAWVKGKHAPGSSSPYQYGETDPISNANDQFTLAWDHSNGSWTKSVFHEDAAGFDAAKFSSTINANTWYFLCGVYNGSQILAYLNGAQDGYRNKGDPTTNSGDLTIGGKSAGPNPNYFDGSIDEFTVSKVARSAAWIKLSYQNQRPIAEQTLVDLGDVHQGSVTPPSGLSYSTNPAVYTQGVAITDNTATLDAGDLPITYAVTPALPSGLSLNASTGTISGTPGAVQAAATYTVTATNSGGSANVVLTITVNPPAPSDLTYDVLSPQYTVNVAIAPNSPSWSGGAPTGFTVSPALPAGLSLDGLTGIISGTPTAAQAAADYTVTASNSGGSDNVVLSITVTPPAPAGLAYGEGSAQYIVGVPITPDSVTVGNGAPVDSFTVGPPLPAGLSFNKTNGAIYGTPTSAQVATPYTVTARNAGGTGTVVVTITVVQPGDVSNPITVTGEFVDSAHVKLVIRGYGALQTPGEDALHNVDMVGIWYSASGFPTAPDWDGPAVFKYVLADLKAAGTPFTDTVAVPALYGSGAYYYFIGSPHWQTALGDTVPPFGPSSSTGAAVLMFDDAPVPITLELTSVAYVEPDTVRLTIGNTAGIVAGADTLLIWYGFVNTVDFGGGTGTVKRIAVDSVKKKDPYVYTIRDSLFSGESKKMYAAIALHGTNGVVSTYVLDSATVGLPIPENPIRLRADSVAAQAVWLSWTQKDSVRIWYGTAQVPTGVNFNTAAFTEINPTRAESTWSVVTLNPDKVYWFGLQRFEGGLWSAVTDTSRISITTPPLGAADTIANRIGIDSAWYDDLTNEITVVFHVDTAGLAAAQLQAGVAYSLAGYPAKDLVGQVIELAGTDSTIVVKRTENLVFDTTYYLGLFLRDFGRTDWSSPTDTSCAAVIITRYKWERVTYLLSGESMTSAFNGNVVLTWTTGLGSGVVDTIRVYEPAALPAGFVEAGVVAIEFSQKLQTAPFTIGILYDTTQFGKTVRMYRDSAGVITVAHTSRVSGDTVWLTTNDVSLPFLVLADTLRPVVTFSADTDTGAVVADGGAVGMNFTVSDNVSNARWALLYGRGNTDYEGTLADTLASQSENFVKVIPANVVNASYGLRALLVVCDGAWCDTINVSRQVAAAGVDEIVVPIRKWTPIRVTASVADTMVDSCLADVFRTLGGKYDTKKFRLFRWFPFAGNASSSTKWLEYADSIKAVFSFAPGRVMWVKSAVQQGIRFGDGASTSLKQPYGMTLAAKNWSDISLPFKFAVRLSDILAATGPGADSLQFCRWEKIATDQSDTTSYTTVDVYAVGLQGLDVPSDTLVYEPLNDAYCVYNPSSTDIVLKVPPNPVAMPALSKASRALAKRASSFDGWSVVLESESGARLNTVRLGVAHTGAGGVAYYPERPRLESAGIGVVESSTRRVYGHATVRGTGENGAGFEVAFINDGTEKREITVRPRVVGAFPEAYAVRLYEPERAVYVAESARYTVAVGPGGRAYRWVVAGDAAYVNDFSTRHIAFRLALFGAVPNPFIRTVAVQYSLPYKRIEELSFVVYDLRGRTVWELQLRNVFSPGFSQVVWDGRDSRGRAVSSGVYVLRMKAREKGSRKALGFETRLTCLQ